MNKDVKITIEGIQELQRRADYERIKQLIENTFEIDVMKIADIMIENYEKNYQIQSGLRLIFERKLNYLNFESNGTK
jgi:ribosomal protein L23